MTNNKDDVYVDDGDSIVCLFLLYVRAVLDITVSLCTPYPGNPSALYASRVRGIFSC